MSLLESILATFQKRFFANHYSYRDFHTVATGSDPTATAATYLFGTNARAVHARNWPAGAGSSFNAKGDYVDARSCLARSVMIQCTEDAFYILSSLNPRWLKRINQYITKGKTYAQAVLLTADDGIAASITEVTAMAPQNAMISLEPTYGVSLTFWQVTASGMIRIWIEGNTEGRD